MSIAFVLVELAVDAHIGVLVQLRQRNRPELQVVLEGACGHALGSPLVVLLQARQELPGARTLNQDYVY